MKKKKKKRAEDEEGKKDMLLCVCFFRVPFFLTSLSVVNTKNKRERKSNNNSYFSPSLNGEWLTVCSCCRIKKNKANDLNRVHRHSGRKFVTNNWAFFDLWFLFSIVDYIYINSCTHCNTSLLPVPMNCSDRKWENGKNDIHLLPHTNMTHDCKS